MTGATFTYDHTGERTVTQIGSRTVTDLVDRCNPMGYSQVLKRTDTGGQSFTNIIGDDTLALRAGSTLQHLLSDSHGSTRLLYNTEVMNPGIQESVSFLGHLSRDELIRAFDMLWVQAVPSHWEELFGLVAAESMTRSTAVVTTNTGVLAEQNVEGHTGYQAPATDIGAWPKALLRLLSNLEHAMTPGTQARAHAERLLFLREVLCQYANTVRTE